MPFHFITDPTEWNAALATLPSRHVLQSWEWGQFKSRWGWSPRYLLYEESGQTRGAALILRRTVGRFLNILYVPKGPALDYSDAALADRILGELAQIAQQDRSIFIKIDPDLAAADRTILLDRGWRSSRDQIQFRNTVLIDLTPNDAQLLAAMKQKTRYNIRLAQKKGVIIREGTLSDLELLYAMYAETSRRDGFLIRPLDYYRDAWGSFIQSGLAQPLIAEVDGQAVAGLILFHFADRAWYMYGMSRNVHRDLMPNHLLQWQAMQWAKSRGCTVYDLWGAPDELIESDSMWGVYKFKEALGGKFAEHVGAYDFVASRFWYWVYSVAMPKVLEVMRSRHQTQA
ncbi:MAG TPA: peptidoglycan bridge formation glycyltransferase FemA/FemB family protein [Anaerolineae bacterium]|nr:peptidoglycan bridge formation glycyltransferase FemA/FemB family protein [Anaerolineae bacterium]